MSILIHGMKMPKDGKSFIIYSDGDVRGFLGCEPGTVGTAIELHHHGRLIDADALMAEFERMQKLNDTRGHEFACSFMSSSMEISTEWYCVEDAVNAAKTIIPADPEKEE